MKLIIQIPCYNEAETLRIALDALPKHIEGIDVIEYLIINDGSKDDTVQVARDWGVNYIVSFRNNKGLARGFSAGIDACLRNGADIIVNTDADNQYCADDIEKLIQPILNKTAGMVIGDRPIDDTEHFSVAKKKLQHLGSWAVRKASGTDIPDAPSGFRAFSRHTAMRLYVMNEYTYTLETIVQAGREKMAVTSVPVRTNPELRPSRLFHSMWKYVKRSGLTLVRAVMNYRPIFFFSIVAAVFAAPGLFAMIRYLVFVIRGNSSGHIQSLIIGSMLLNMAIITLLVGFLADLSAGNRRLTAEVRFELRRIEYGLSHEEEKQEMKRGEHTRSVEETDEA